MRSRPSLRLAALTLLLCVLFSACARSGYGETVSAAVPSFPPLPATDGLRIAVASDLHFNPGLRPGGEEAYEAAYSLELVDALLWDVRQQGAELLLLTGDLCNGGRLAWHEQLTEKLRRAQEDGLKIYALPGNHDLAPVTQTEFAALYADLGYGEAFSRDSASLSYAVLRDDCMLLMMDTAGYGVGAIDLPDAPGSIPETPFLTVSTLHWAERMLQEASARGLRVLAAGHYNLLPEVSRDPESRGYYLENGELFASLLRRYQVPLYCSGHMHIRAVYQEDGLTELLTEYLLAYPTAYSVLDLEAKELVYTPRRIDVDAWASESGQSDALLLHFAQWQQDELYRYSVQNVADMAERNPLSRKEKAQAAEFFYRVMDAYWRGSLPEEREALTALPGHAAFLRCAEGYAYGWWLQNLLDTASPLLHGFRLAY